MNVLSLFDGMSCGQIALKELGVKVDGYYASEIDRHAIAQTQINFPDWYVWRCSDTQAYKMLGNGWTVAVIAHILQHLSINKQTNNGNKMD